MAIGPSKLSVTTTFVSVTVPVLVTVMRNHGLVPGGSTGPGGTGAGWKVNPLSTETSFNVVIPGVPSVGGFGAT